MLRGVQQQRRSITPAAARVDDLGAKPSQPRALQLFQRPQLDDRQQLVGRVRCARLERRLRSGQRTGHAPCRIRGQRSRPLQKPGCRCDAASTLGPLGRSFEFVGHGLVGSVRRMGAMPGSAVGIGVWIGRLGERAMHLLALGRARETIGGRAHERMVEAHPRAELDQPGRLGRRCCARSDAQPLRCAKQQRDVADRLGGRGEQQLLRRSRQRLDAAQEASLDATRQQ